MNDVTDSKRLEEVIRTAAHEWRKTFDAMNDAVAWIDCAGRIVRCNKALAVLAEKDYADIIGHHCEEVVYGTSVPAAGCPIKEVMTTHRRATSTLTAGARIYKVTAEPLFAESGEFIGALHIMSDATQQEKAEQALRGLVLQQQAILDNIPDIAWLKDDRSRFLAVNEPFGRACGVAPADLVGKTDLDIWPRELAERYLADDAEVMRSRTRKVVEEPLADKAGKTTWIETIKTPIIDEQGHVIGTTGIARDISERKRTERHLRDSRLLYEKILSSLDEAVLIAEVETRRILDCNPATEKMFGYRREEMIGRDTRFLHVNDEMFRTFAEEKLARIAEKGFAEFEFRMRRKNGEVFPTEHFLRPLRDDAGNSLGVVSVVRDISARKKAEEAILEQKAFTEQLLQGSSVATFVINDRHEVILWNKACEELTGIPSSAMIGSSQPWKPFYDGPRPVLANLVLDRKAGELSRLYPESSPSILAPAGLHAERWLDNLNGKKRYIAFDAAPICDSTGSVVAAIETIQDLTARKRAEEAIAESEERYRNFFDNANDMIQSVAPDGRFLQVNAAWRKVLGYDEDDLRSLKLFDIVHPSCLKSCTANFSKVMSGEPIGFLETKFIAKDGRVVDLEGSASAGRDGSKVVSTQVIFRDVTERKKLQEDIFRMSHDWEETFNTITDMVTVHDRDFNIIRANKAADKILGLPFLEVKNVKCFEYFHGTGCPPAGCPSCATLVTGEPCVNEIYEPHLGRHLEIRAIPRLDSNNQVIGLIHVVRDISERKKNEEALEKYSRELTALNAASNTLIRITNLKDIYQEICDIIFAVFDLRMVWLGSVEERERQVRPVAHAGHEDGYLATRHFTWDDSPLGMGPTGMAVKNKTIRLARLTDIAFAPWRTAAEKRGYLASMAVPLIDSSHECVGVLNFYSGDTDYFTSDRMQLCQIFANQAAIAIENARHVTGLEEKVDVRTREYESINFELQQINRELEVRRKEAESANRAKSDFLASMSHELRTPLNAIIGFSDLMIRGMSGQLLEKQKEYLGDIYAGGRHLLSLINDILDLSKVEAGKMGIEASEYDLAELIGRSLVMFREKALKHRLDLRAEIEDAIPPVLGDERKIRQVIYNLVSNAVKFTPDGGVIVIRAAKVQADHRDHVEIAVSDTGIGISPEDQKRLFQPFSQIGHHLTKEHEGSGLGLALCKSFVEMHAGVIRVESAPGKGSTFTLRIPLRFDKEGSR